MRNTVIVDAGPMVGLVNERDPAHEWAVRTFRELPGRYVSFEAAIAEAMHVLGNKSKAWTTLNEFVSRVHIVRLRPSDLRSAFALGDKWAPRMDFADACAVHIAKTFAKSFVLTTDFRDFSSYGVPFASPEGAFLI